MPCHFALLTASVPARRWSTRADLVAAVSAGRTYLEVTALRDVSTERAAAHAGLSVFHFHRLFRSIYGQTPHQVILERRLSTAVELLVATRQPLWRIGQQVGLAGAPGLCRFVKGMMGVTAGELRVATSPARHIRKNR